MPIPLEFLAYNDISGEMAQRLQSQLSANPKRPVHVRVNSYGGDPGAGLAMLNGLRAHPEKVTITVEGIAASAATLLLCAGYARIHQNATVMVHRPWAEVVGNADALRDWGEHLATLDNTLTDIYAARTGKDPAEIKKTWLDGRDHWLTAEEALQNNLVDEILPAGRIAARLGSLNPPQRITSILNATAHTETQAQANAAATTQAQAFLSAAAIVEMCTAEPGLVSDLLRKPRTHTEVTARLDDALQIRQMAKCAHLSARDVDSLVYAGVSPELAGKQIVRMMAEADRAIGEISNIHTGEVVGYGGYGGAHFMSAATDALVARMGGKVKNPHPAAHDFQDTSLTGMAAVCLSAVGRNTVGMSRHNIVKMALTTSDFPNLLNSTAGKSLTTRFEDLSAQHRELCDTTSLPDFKTHAAINVSFLPGLVEKKEAGEIKYGSLSDGAETYKLATYARGLVLSREALVNDDLQAFTALIQSAATASARLERDLVFGILTANAAMSDSVALFHANHGNLDASAAGVTVAGLNAARVLMRKQQDSNGGYILTNPRFIVCPVAVEGDAEAVVTALTYRPASNVEQTTPKWVSGLMVVSDPRLDAHDAADWYLLSDPTTAPVIRLAYLDNVTAPVVEQDGDFDRDVTKFKIRFDVAAAAVGWAGAVKMA